MFAPKATDAPSMEPATPGPVPQRPARAGQRFANGARANPQRPRVGNQATLRLLSQPVAVIAAGEADLAEPVSEAPPILHDTADPVVRRDAVNGAGSAAGSTPGQNSSSALPPECSSSSSAACEPPVDYAKLAWPQLLPGAHGINGGTIARIDLHTPNNDFTKWGSGQDPTLSYVDKKKIKTDGAPAEPQGGSSGPSEADAQAMAKDAAFQAAQDQAVAQIVAARAKIPGRAMGRSINNNAGYDYNPDKDPAAADYNQWTKSALPSGVQATDWGWQVFQKIQGLEGQEGRFTTFDKTLSVGPGNSTSGGQTQQVIGKTFKILPEVASVAFDAGLTVDPGGAMSVVDPQKRWILNGQDAAAYLQTDTSLLSLLVNVSQGTQHVAGGAAGAAVTPDEQGKQRQGLLDAEWQQFNNVTLNGLTGMVKGWPIDSAVLAVHAKHAQPGPFPYSFWDSHADPSLAAMVGAIFDKVGESGRFICSGKYAAFAPKPKPSGS